MAISRAARITSNGLVGSYLHAPAGAEGGEAVGGKIGVLVELQGVPAAARTSDAVQTLVRNQLVQHRKRRRRHRRSAQQATPGKFALPRFHD